MSEIKTLAQLLDSLRRGEYITKKDSIKENNQYAACTPEKDKRHFCIAVAGHNIEINCLHMETYSLCEKFLCETEAEIHVTICKDDLEYERRIAEKGSPVQNDGYLETLAVYRKICKALLADDIFLMHGAVIATGKNAYMFTAKSGTGKTTHIRKWLEKLEDAYVVNGDKPLIRITDTEAIACGTPWCGKEKMSTNCMIPLKAIVLMERGEDNHISEISFGDAFTFLLQQTYQPNRTDDMKKTLRLISQLKGRVKFYKFTFNNMKEDCFTTAYKALTGEIHEAAD